jgi:2-polyprenyl-3-methyl-5-hydroxy-6-metoxy-1,4-benzoquinol methylase
VLVAAFGLRVGAEVLESPLPTNRAMTKLLWNAYAQCYERITRLLPYQEMLDEVVAGLPVAPGMRVLDAGCGTGVLGERLAAACPDIEYLGVDLSPAMLARARRRCPWPPSFTFVEANLDDVLVQGGPGYDRIVTVNVLWTLPDPAATLARMAASLAPGGRMLHTTPRLAFHPHVVVWQHLRRQRGCALVRALLGLPILLVAGLLNLILVVQSAFLARGSGAKRRWHEDGLVVMLREAGLVPAVPRPCYAGQGLLLEAARPDGNPLPEP